MQASAAFMLGENVVNSSRIIYTPTEFAKNSLIYLQEAGELSALKVHESSRFGLSSYLFFMVLRGRGTLTVEGTEYEMKVGDCAFVDCMLNYSHRSSEELWQLKWVHFNGSNVAGIYEKYKDRGGRYVFTPKQEQFSKLSELIGEIRNIADSKSYVRDMELNEKLTCILTELMRHSWNEDKSSGSSEKRKDLKNIHDYIDTHYYEDIKLDNLAEMFYINKFYLTRIFKEQYGITINKYLSQVRITNSKRRLRFSDMSVEQIAEACGYSDANFFIRMFKRSEGMTPGEFRSKWRT